MRPLSLDRGVPRKPMGIPLIHRIINHSNLSAFAKRQFLKKWLVQHSPSWNQCCTLLTVAQGHKLHDMLMVYTLPLVNSWATCSKMFMQSLTLHNASKSHLLVESFLKATSLAGSFQSKSSWMNSCRIMNRIRAAREIENESQDCSSEKKFENFISKMPTRTVRKAYASLFNDSFANADWQTAVINFVEMQRANCLELHHVLVLIKNLNHHRRYGAVIDISDDFLSSIRSQKLRGADSLTSSVVTLQATATRHELEALLNNLYEADTWQACLEVYQKCRPKFRGNFLNWIDTFFRQKKRRSMLSHIDFFRWFYNETDAINYKISKFTATFILTESFHQRHTDLTSMFIDKFIKSDKTPTANAEGQDTLGEIIQADHQRIISERIALCESLRKVKVHRWIKALDVFHGYSDVIRVEANVCRKLIPYIAKQEVQLRSLFKLVEKTLSKKQPVSDSNIQLRDRRMTSGRAFLAAIIETALKHRNYTVLKEVARKFPSLFSIDEYFFPTLDIMDDLPNNEKQENLCSIWGVRECVDFVICRLEALHEEITLSLSTSDWMAALQLYKFPIQAYSWLQPSNGVKNPSFKLTHGKAEAADSYPNLLPQKSASNISNFAFENALQELYEVFRSTCDEAERLLLNSGQQKAVLYFAVRGLLRIRATSFILCLNYLDQVSGREYLNDISAVLHEIVDRVKTDELLPMSSAIRNFANKLMQASLSAKEYTCLVRIVWTLLDRRRKIEFSPCQDLHNLRLDEERIVRTLSEQVGIFSCEAVYQVFQLLCWSCDASHIVEFIRSLKKCNHLSTEEWVVVASNLANTCIIFDEAVAQRLALLVRIQGLWNCKKEGLKDNPNKRYDADIISTKICSDVEKNVNSAPFVSHAHLLDFICKILALCRRESAWQISAVVFDAYRKKTFRTMILGKIPLFVKRLFALAYLPHGPEILHKQIHLNDPVTTCIMLRKSFKRANLLNELSLKDIVFGYGVIHNLSTSEIVFVFDSLVMCNQQPLAIKLYFQSRLLHGDAHRAILRRIDEKLYPMAITDDSDSMMKLLTCYVLFDSAWYGVDYVVPMPEDWMKNLKSKFALRYKTCNGTNLIQRTVEESDFFKHCLTNFLHAQNRSPFQLAFLFYRSGIFPENHHVEMLWTAYFRGSEAQCDVTREYFACLLKNRQILYMPEASTDMRISQSKSIINSIDQSASLGAWSDALQSLVRSARSMFVRPASMFLLHEGRKTSKGLQNSQEGYIFFNTVNAVIDSLLKNDLFDMSLQLVSIAHMSSPRNPFLHVSFLRIVQKHTDLRQKGQKFSVNTSLAVNNLLNMLVSHILSKDKVPACANHFQVTPKPNVYVQGAYIKAYLETVDKHQNELFRLTRHEEVFPVGFLETSTADRYLVENHQHSYPVNYSGFTYSISTLLKVSTPELVFRHALKDIKECRPWEGALHRLSLSWGKKSFDVPYEKAALYAVLLQSKKRNLGHVLHWKLVLELLAFHNFTGKHLEAVMKNSSYGRYLKFAATCSSE